jgi:hypothetical protein
MGTTFSGCPVDGCNEGRRLVHKFDIDEFYSNIQSENIIKMEDETHNEMLDYISLVKLNTTDINHINDNYIYILNNNSNFYITCINGNVYMLRISSHGYNSFRLILLDTIDKYTIVKMRTSMIIFNNTQYTTPLFERIDNYYINDKYIYEISTNKLFVHESLINNKNKYKNYYVSKDVFNITENKLPNSEIFYSN